MPSFCKARSSWRTKNGLPAVFRCTTAQQTAYLLDAKRSQFDLREGNAVGRELPLETRDEVRSMSGTGCAASSL